MREYPKYRLDTATKLEVVAVVLLFLGMLCLGGCATQPRSSVDEMISIHNCISNHNCAE